MRFWQQFRRRLLGAFDQVFMMFNLPTLTNDLEGRLRRLRAVYYHNPRASISHGRVRDILHGHVDKRYRLYYDRLLSVERTIADYCKSLPRHLSGNDILFRVQLLGENLAALVEELQAVETQRKQLGRGTATVGAELKQKQHEIKARLEDGLRQQAEIPLRLQKLSYVEADRNMTALQDELERLTLFIDDVGRSYDEIRADNSNRLENQDNA